VSGGNNDQLAVRQPILDGATINLGGRDFIVPALSLKLIRKLRPKLQQLSAMSEMPTDEDVSNVAAIAHEALKRNYPNLELDYVEDLIDLRNLGDVVGAITGVSGLTRSAGAGKADGRETTSIGAVSTASSQP